MRFATSAFDTTILMTWPMLASLLRAPGRAGRRHIFAREDTAVPVGLQVLPARSPPFDIEMELVGRIQATPVVVDPDAVLLELAEPVRSTGASGEARLPAGPRRFGVGLQPDEGADQAAPRVEPNPHLPATLTDERVGLRRSHDLHHRYGTTETGGAPARERSTSHPSARHSD